ncbi:MAG: winged helix-turn-helix domain-containing protein [Deltaproteobacteria bacterium]|nr:winged helix-turn-helix domain-containing protein [Deltaproteobacteria bacterium]
MAEARLLLVEDDERLASLTSEYLTQSGFEVAIESRGDRAVDRILADDPDLVVLDLMLPGEDGLSICRRVRPSWSGPILMLTARGEEIDQVLGLEMGADDYVAKPVSPRLLLARIRALLRRKQTPVGDDEKVVVGSLVVDRSTREARIDGVAMDMTSAEFDLLWLLASHAGKPLTREELIRHLRGIEYDGIDRSMDVRVSQLRRKLAQDPRHADRIKTVRGVGYQFAPES